MATFVLVPGGFHGGWCYARVASRLRALGHEVHTPTLSGLAERAHLPTVINLSTHVQDVVDLFLYEDLTDVVLCGHSYAGMVITGVSGRIPERIRSLFYIDGTVPDDGQSLVDVRGPDATLSLLEAVDETGTMIQPLSARHFGVNDDDVEWVDRMCTPHPIACFLQKLRLTGREGLVTRRTYVRTDRFPSPVTQAMFAKFETVAGWKTATLDCGHDAMLDDPAGLAALLLEELERG